VATDYQAIFERMERDRKYYEAHYEQFLEQYPEQWVAILDEQMVGADADFDRLLSALRERGVPTEKALIEWITADEDVLILPG
jgi:hypothetical protein